MALIRWEPAREINTIQQEVNRLFGTLLDAQGGAETGPGRRWIPAMDLVEEGGHYVLRADLPGLTEDDVKIEVEDRVLTLSGERRSEHTEKRDGYRRIERASGRFSRTLTLPEGTDPGAIEASFENGVLEVGIPKPAETKPHRVEVRAGRTRTIEGQVAEPAGADAPQAEREHAAA
jgi:HSP20 family protein